MNSYPYWQFHCARWLTGKIASLPLDEQGLFLHFCMMAWVSHGPFNICSTLVQRKFNKTQEWVEQAVRCMVDCGILVKSEEQYRIKFIDEQLAGMNNMREKRSLAGKASVDARKNKRSKGKVRKGKEECSTHVEQVFNEFWSVYPRKEARKKALQAWINAKDKPDISVIKAAVERQRSSPQWTKDGGQFIPYPATWLNQGRWADQATGPLFDSRSDNNGMGRSVE